MDLISLYVNRPQHRSSKEMLQKKNLIKSQNNTLVEQGKELFSNEKTLQENETQESKINLLKAKSTLQVRIDEWQETVSIMEKHYSIFKLELYLENVNPCVYVAYLILGMFSLCLSMLWLVYMIMNQLVNSGQSSEFLSYLLLAIEESPVSPLAPLFFLLLVYYVNICVVSGYMQMSRRLPRCFSLQ